jgi:hypothetical protein
MSSITNIYGIQPYTWIPGPDFKAGFDDKGKWSGTQTFTCRKFDFDSTPIQTAFQKGQSVTVLYPNLSAKWNFLTVDSVSHEHEPGGLTKILVNYTGYSADWEFDKNDDSGTYAYNATLTEVPIMTNPNFLTTVSQEDQDLIRGCLAGRLEKDLENSSEATYYIKNLLGTRVGTITLAAAIAWFDIIVTQGQETWQVSQVEWTHSATDQGGVDPSYLGKLGWIDPDPDGEPPVIAGRNWRLTAISDSQTKQGAETTSDYSITWTMSPPGQVWNVKLYTKPT